MTDNIHKINQEDLDRIEEELLEEEAAKEEEKMRIEGRSVFEIERLKRKRSRNNQDSKKQDTDKIQ